MSNIGDRTSSTYSLRNQSIVRRENLELESTVLWSAHYIEETFNMEQLAAALTELTKFQQEQHHRLEEERHQEEEKLRKRQQEE